MTLKIHGTDNIQPGSIQAASLASGVGGGPKITNVVVTDSSYNVLDDTAVGLSGGYIKITGTGFASGCQVVVGATVATVVVFVSNTEIRAQIPAQSAGSYTLYVTNSDGGVAIRVNAVNYSSTPTWTTTSPLDNAQRNTSISIQLTATSNSSVTYALQAGSSLPSGLTLSSSGLITGTTPNVENETTYNFTVVATDLENQDTPQAFQVTITAGDLYFKYVTLLLNNQTNNVLTDSSTNNFNLTAYGDSRASNFTPYGTGWSIQLDSGAMYISGDGSAVNFGTGDFTIEMWFKVATLGTYNLLDTCPSGNATPTNRILFRANSNGSFQYITYQGSTTYITTATGLITAGKWHHVAMVKSSGVTRIYVDGIASGNTYSDSLNYPSQTNRPIFSADGYSPGYTATGISYSNVRIVKGIAVYTGNFIPPTQLQVTQSSGTNIAAITGSETALLIGHTNRFVDASTSNRSVTPVNTVRIVSDNPANIINTGTAGSMYFDGTGDYVQIANSANLAVGAGDFTIECWVNTSTFSLDTYFRRIFTFGSDAANNLQLLFFDGTNAVSTVNVYSNTILINGTITVANGAWHHVAVCRSGASLKLFVDGVQSGSTATTSQNFDSAATNGLYIGRHSLAGGHFLGFMSDFRVVKGTALYTTTFTPPTQPLTAITNTQLLTLQYRQPHNNHTFLDSSTNNHLITRNGNATQGTFSPFSQAGWSNYLGTSSERLTTSTSNSAFSFGTGDFTVEAWVYVTDTTNCMFFQMSTASTGYNGAVTNSVAAYIGGGATPSRLEIYAANSSYSSSSAVVSATTINQWHHFAIVRASGVTKAYWDGTVVPGLDNITDTFNYSTTYCVIGTVYNNTYALKGYISNFRVVKGRAVYTANFVPPTTEVGTTSGGTNPPQGTECVFLTAQSNRFRDSSSNNIGLTVTGSPSVQAFSPFNPAAVYNPATHGGSAYFDGSGDYLYLNDVDIFNFDTKPFTVECWVYPTASVATGYYYVISKWRTAPNKEIIFGLASNNGTWSYVYTTDGGTDKFITDPTAIVPYCWTHYAVSRTANTISLFRNGVRVATSTETGSLYDTSGYGITIAAHEHDRGSNFPGYVAGLRAVRGTAVYDATQTTITVPSAPLDVVSNTTLLLNFTDAGVYDASGKNVLETVGDAKTSTAQSKFGGSSIYFDGNGDGLTASASASQNIAPGSGNFTAEGWVYIPTLGNWFVLFSIGDTVNASGIGLQIGANGRLVVVNNNQYPIDVSSGAVSAATWTHLAMVRAGTTVTIYVNGVSIAQGTFSSTFSGRFDIGSGMWNGTYYPNSALGYIDDFRYTKYARYTSNFTPPQQPHQLQ